MSTSTVSIHLPDLKMEIFRQQGTKVYCRFLAVLTRMRLKLSLWIVASGILVVTVLILSVGSASAGNHPTQVGPGGGTIAGYVFGFTMFDEREPLVWASVTARSGPYSFSTTTGQDGQYGMFLPTGVYNVTVDAGPAYKAQSTSATVSNGGASDLNFYLERSNVPIPEFPTQLVSVILVAAFAAALIAQRKIRHKRGLSSQ
jgi:hypothetical protein